MWKHTFKICSYGESLTLKPEWGYTLKHILYRGSQKYTHLTKTLQKFYCTNQLVTVLTSEYALIKPLNACCFYMCKNKDMQVSNNMVKFSSALEIIKFPSLDK